MHYAHRKCKITKDFTASINALRGVNPFTMHYAGLDRLPETTRIYFLIGNMVSRLRFDHEEPCESRGSRTVPREV